MKKNTINKVWIAALYVTLFAVNFIYSGYFIGEAYPGHNMISNLVMAAAPINNLGLPYADYWDIYPPGIYIFLSLFERFFNGETMVFKLFHVVFSMFIGIIVLSILIRIFKKHVHAYLLVTVFFILYLVLSNYYYCILFHNAFLALFFSCSALYLLMFSKKELLKYFMSTLMFAFSASMKETYLFTALLPVAYLCNRYLLRENKSAKLFCKNIAFVIGAVLIVFLTNYCYLKMLGVQNSYQEISAYKSEMMIGKTGMELFNALNPLNVVGFGNQFKDLSNAFFVHSFSFMYALYLVLLVAITISINRIDGKYKVVYNRWDSERSVGVIVLFFLLLHFEGFKLLNKYGPNYSLQMVPSLVLAFAYLCYKTKGLFNLAVPSALNILSVKQRKVFSVIVIIGLIWILLPRFSNFTFYKLTNLNEYVSGFVLRKPKILLPDNIKRTMGKDQRVLYIYGWGTPYFYYFTGTKPFSRFFILHPDIMGEKQMKEYANAFKKELPKVVLYTEIYSDMDTQKFEDNYIQIKKILEACYDFYPTDQFDKFHCKGYYLLRDESYFKEHISDFVL